MTGKDRFPGLLPQPYRALHLSSCCAQTKTNSQAGHELSKNVHAGNTRLITHCKSPNSLLLCPAANLGGKKSPWGLFTGITGLSSELCFPRASIMHRKCQAVPMAIEMVKGASDSHKISTIRTQLTWGTQHGENEGGPQRSVLDNLQQNRWRTVKNTKSKDFVKGPVAKTPHSQSMQGA